MMETDLHAEASDETYSETINFSDSVEDDLALANLSSKWDSPVASPPPPPPMPPTDLGIRFQIYKLQEQVELLEQIISEPQIIAVTGIQNLKQETGQSWKDRLIALLFEARVPYFWAIDIVPNDDNHVDPNLAYIYFINHQTKNEAIKCLTEFLASDYDNRVYIL